MAMRGIEQPNDPVLDDLVSKLSAVYHPEKIYLFGSRATGNARADSDYDLLILIQDDAPDELKTATKGYEALWGIRVPVDVVVWTHSEFYKRVDIPNTLPAEVVREGREVHVA